MPKVSAKQVQRRIAELDAQYTVAQPKRPDGFTILRRVLALIVLAIVAVASILLRQSHHVRLCPAQPETWSCACHVGSSLTPIQKRRVRWTLSKALPSLPPSLAFSLSEATPMKIGVVAFTTTLMLAGASHAADKIALICSDAKGKDDYSLSIDLDRKLASFHMSDLPDADDIPVTRVTENYIWFQNKASVWHLFAREAGSTYRIAPLFSSATQQRKRLLSTVQASEAV